LVIDVDLLFWFVVEEFVFSEGTLLFSLWEVLLGGVGVVDVLVFWVLGVGVVDW
jgi:hypothetical protein